MRDPMPEADLVLTTPRKALVPVLLICLAFCVGCVMMIVDGIWFGSVGLVFFGLCTLVVIGLVVAAFDPRRQQHRHGVVCTVPQQALGPGRLQRLPSVVLRTWGAPCLLRASGRPGDGPRPDGCPVDRSEFVPAGVLRLGSGGPGRGVAAPQRRRGAATWRVRLGVASVATPPVAGPSLDPDLSRSAGDRGIQNPNSSETGRG